MLGKFLSPLTSRFFLETQSNQHSTATATISHMLGVWACFGTLQATSRPSPRNSPPTCSHLLAYLPPSIPTPPPTSQLPLPHLSPKASQTRSSLEGAASWDPVLTRASEKCPSLGLEQLQACLPASSSDASGSKVPISSIASSGDPGGGCGLPLATTTKGMCQKAEPSCY